MKIKCKACGHTEKINMPFFCKLLGLGVAGLGSVTVFVAALTATGLSLPICLAIIGGGLVQGLYGDEILAWVRKRFACPKCGSKDWKPE